MGFILAYLILSILIAFEMIIYNRVFSRILLILKIPALLFLAYFLFWFWGGDGSFNLIVFPTILAFLELVIFICLRKVGRSTKTRLVLINVILFIVPVTAMLLTSVLAILFGVDNRVM